MISSISQVYRGIRILFANVYHDCVLPIVSQIDNINRTSSTQYTTAVDRGKKCGWSRRRNVRPNPQSLSSGEYNLQACTKERRAPAFTSFYVPCGAWRG